MQIWLNTIKKRLILLLCLVLPAGISLAAYADTDKLLVIECDDQYAIQVDQIEQEREKVWDSYRKTVLSDPVMQRETNACAMTCNDAVMRYYVTVIGRKPENGYPMYIALHGGGSGDTPDFNDEQWEDMKLYYSSELNCGVYVAVRGVRDTWDTHFNPESYPLYDRLIQYMILTKDIDPNRVYLEGFSAGGDGVYAIAPRMADRFAAVNTSSGHPNGVQLLNLYNLPIQLQAGEFDDAYNRNTVTAEYGIKLDLLKQTYGGFEHRTLIHYDCGHNYEDYSRISIPVMRDPAKWLVNGDRSNVDVNSFPPDYMDQFVRNPIPERIIWDLSTRATMRETMSHYYLRAPYDTNRGILMALLDRKENAVILDVQELNGPFSLFLNEEMVDFSQMIRLEVNGEATMLSVMPDRRILEKSTYDRGDPCYQFEAEIHFDASGNIIL